MRKLNEYEVFSAYMALNEKDRCKVLDRIKDHDLFTRRLDAAVKLVKSGFGKELTPHQLAAKIKEAIPS